MSAPGCAQRIRERVGERPIVDALVDALRGPLGDPEAPGGHHTLLAVCPISETIARAALLAADEANAPLLYAATLNQVDRDGGYTGWTPASFADFVDRDVEQHGTDVPVVLGLDHGGPWKKDAHVQNDLSYEDTLAEVKASLTACIDAGYELLHLDPTVDRRLPPNTPVPIDAIVERTVDLLAFAESVRCDRGRDPIAYEVGTEEVGGGLQTEDRFGAFLHALDDALDAHDLPRPCFVVGDVGTKLDTDHFNPVRAQHLTAAADQHLGALVKGHYTDDVTDRAAYPLSGMGGANVGPGVSAAEYDALQDLVRLEDRLDGASGFINTLRDAVVDSGRWRKWLRPEEEGLSFDALPQHRRDWLLRTGSRYVWVDPAVTSARDRLYANVSRYRDAEAFVHWRVKTELLRYFHAFHLIDFNDRLLETL